MATKPTLNLKLDKEARQVLRNKAQSFGLFIGRGPMATEGSIQKMMERVVSGELDIIEAPQTRFKQQFGEIPY